MSNRPTIEAWAARYECDNYLHVKKFAALADFEDLHLLVVTRTGEHPRDTFFSRQRISLHYLRGLQNDWRIHVARVIRRMRALQRLDIKAATAAPNLQKRAQDEPRRPTPRAIRSTP